MEMDLYIYKRFYRSRGKFFVIDTITCPTSSVKTTKFIIAYIAFSSTAGKIWNSLQNALGTTCDINVLKILNYRTISPPFSNLPFKIPAKGGGPGDIHFHNFRVLFD